MLCGVRSSVKTEVSLRSGEIADETRRRRQPDKEEFSKYELVFPRTGEVAYVLGGELVRTPSRSRKTDILQAAARLFLVGGYSHTSVAQVAGAWACSKDRCITTFAPRKMSGRSPQFWMPCAPPKATCSEAVLRPRTVRAFGEDCKRILNISPRVTPVWRLFCARLSNCRAPGAKSSETGWNATKNAWRRQIRLGQHRGVVAAGDPAALVQLMIGPAWACWIDREPEQQALVNHGILRLLFPGIGNSNPLTPERERFSSSRLLRFERRRSANLLAHDVLSPIHTKKMIAVRQNRADSARSIIG